MGHVVAFDICKELIEMAPAHPLVEYFYGSDAPIFTPSHSYDLVWLCLVCGGIPDEILGTIAHKITNHLDNQGMILLIDHITDGDVDTGNNFWKFRSLDKYHQLFKGIEFCKVGMYFEAGNPITVLAGKVA